MNKIERIESLMPNNTPKYVRCYDNGGKSFDRYTVVFTGHYKKYRRSFLYLAMSANPYSPMGFGLHGESENMPIDRPTYSHLGKKIKFSDLPIDCQKAVIEDYIDIWNL